jgi:small neutral amino acid transporter SnatA (MarC family)
MSQLVFDGALLIVNILLIVLITYIFFRVAKWLLNYINHRESNGDSR